MYRYSTYRVLKQKVHFQVVDPVYYTVQYIRLVLLNLYTYCILYVLYAVLGTGTGRKYLSKSTSTWGPNVLKYCT